MLISQLPRYSTPLACISPLDAHGLRRGLRRHPPNRTLACISRTRHARSPQRVARTPGESHSRLHFAHSTRTISAEGCAGSRPIALSPAFRALDTRDLRRGLRAQPANCTLACISRTRHARSPQRVARTPGKSHSRLHFAHSTRTISAEGCARSRRIALSPAFRALDTHDLRRGLRAHRTNRTLACISRTRHCKECLQRHGAMMQPWQCMACYMWKQEDAFVAKYRRPQCTFYRVCETCEETKVCAQCGRRKAKAGFAPTAWLRTRGASRVCLACTSQAHGHATRPRGTTQKANACFTVRGPETQFRSQESQPPKLPRGTAAKAVARLAATRAKVEQRKHERIIAEVLDHRSVRQPVLRRDGKAQAKQHLHMPAAGAWTSNVEDKLITGQCAATGRQGWKSPRKAKA